MKRQIYNQLLAWKQSKRRKPLLLQGARQVGKTYIINQFGKSEYKKIIYLNFEQNPELESLFTNELYPQKIIENIGIYFKQKITSAETLIFFDEIQVVPKVITSLKYFYEQAPDYHIISAGSLLGVSVSKKTSFPVGKINFMMLYPMNFTEYLTACNEGLLVKKLQNIKKIEAFPDIIHKKLLTHLKKYMFLGGMPEVLQNYFDNKNISSARQIQNEILEAYKRDFSKYTSKSQAIKTSEVWNSVPYQLAKENKKFKYSDVRKNSRSSIYEQTIEWLKNAGLINVTYNISVPKLPLSGYANYLKFKLYMHDTGLLGAMLNLSQKIILKPTKLFREYNGAFTENFVATELVTGGLNNLYYWSSKSEAEVDFVIQKEDKIFPIEVKSGMSRNIKSLRSYADKYNPELMFRLSPRNFIKSDNFINLPLYATSYFCFFKS
ncbi:MAG: AAA family ATPase [Candidatus Marinimicrobia bacterium]|nr:AAA family ATPase [Candidatus Neomarinimicrobiota bacterium]